MGKKIIRWLGYILLVFLLSACQTRESSEITPEEIPKSDVGEIRPTDEKIIGITIDDSWYESIQLTQIVEAIRKMPAKPTVRIVMSRDIHPIQYVEMFKKIHDVAYVMASPVDSYDMIYYKSEASYRKRFAESYGALNDYVDLWEIGNEINGEGWLGDDNKLIVEKMISAFELLEGKNAKTVLTAYYTAPNLQKVEMHEWLNKNVPKSMKNHLDYLFVSYYEEDNENFEPNWQEIFETLEKDFPNSKLGIGECGVADEKATLDEKIKKAERYYSMPKYTKNYVGGYFWWYWVTDCVPAENNKLYETINQSMGS